MSNKNYSEIYMHRCLQIAAFARGNTSPNPMVGALIVCDDRVIAEGYHNKAGDPHAEPNAINAIENKEILKRSTLYVNLEPCSHYGKTPPCAELIIKMGIPHVVVGMLDPNQLVAGRGVEMMKKAGIKVDVGVLEKECRELNKRFITFHTKKRPYIILKWAQTADGYIDACRVSKADGDPIRISNEVTKTLNHQIRTHEDAILVGTQTALLDDPHLTSRKWGAKNPVRCVIDLSLRLPSNLQLWNDEAVTICFIDECIELNTTAHSNVDYVAINKKDNVTSQIMKALYDRNIQSVIIEGGTFTLNEFIKNNLWDEARIESSDSSIQLGVKAPYINAKLFDSKKYYNNTMRYYKNDRSSAL